MASSRIARHPPGSGVRSWRKIAGFGKLALGLVIVAADDGVVRALEQPVLLQDKLQRMCWRIFGASAPGPIWGDDDRRGNVVLRLKLGRGMKILPESNVRQDPLYHIRSAGTGLPVSCVRAELVGRRAVDDIHGELVPPRSPHDGFQKRFTTNTSSLMCWEWVQPFVVRVVVIPRGWE